MCDIRIAKNFLQIFRWARESLVMQYGKWFVKKKKLHARLIVSYLRVQGMMPDDWTNFRRKQRYPDGTDFEIGIVFVSYRGRANNTSRYR